MNRHWRVRLGDVVEIKGGGTPSKSVPRFWGGDIPWVSPKDMKPWDIADSEDKITADAIAASATNLVPSGSVLLVNRSGILKHTLPVGIARRPVAINQDVKALICGPRAHPDYIAHLVKAFEPVILKWVRATTADNFPIENLRNLEIPFPPLDEQRRIAAILDKADALRQKRKRAIALLDSLTQSIFFEMFGEGGRWPARPLAEVVSPGTIVTYGIVQAGDEFEGGVPYIRTGDIENGRIRLSGLRHTDPAIAAKFERSRVRRGEIVMSIRATVGTTAAVPPELDGANLTQGTARIAPGPETSATYLLHYLRSGRIQTWIKRQVKGATFLEITLGRLRELGVELPPLDVQERFASLVGTIERMLIVATKHSCEAESLFASLQHRAFSSQL